MTDTWAELENLRYILQIIKDFTIFSCSYKTKCFTRLYFTTKHCTKLHYTAQTNTTLQNHQPHQIIRKKTGGRSQKVIGLSKALPTTRTESETLPTTRKELKPLPTTIAVSQALPDNRTESEALPTNSVFFTANYQNQRTV